MEEVVFLDTEATGLSVEKDRIVSISALYINDRAERFIFNELVNPTIPIPKESTAIHGINDDHVKPHSTFSVVGKAFFQWMFDTVGPNPIVCAYNGLGYDFSIIYYELKRHKVAMPAFVSVRGYDPVKQARVVLKELPSKRQAAVFEHLYGKAPSAQHTSMGDVYALQSIVAHDKFASSAKDYFQPLALFMPKVPFAI